MKASERMQIPRQDMPEQNPKARARNFEEVPLGLTDELAKLEAQRCLKCANPQCITGCPVQVPIQEFIKLIEDGDVIGAARKIKEVNALPAVCGRVCPQEVQCEGRCILGKKGKPVAIGNLERYCADYERNQEIQYVECPATSGKKIAVIGSGPSGLTVARDLIALGYRVEIFEAFHRPGGVLVYGIPEFRLPKRIVQAEIDFLKSQGVIIHLDSVIGQIRTVKELLDEDGFSAVYLGVGAGLPWFLNIPGENLKGVFSANEYLTRTNLMCAYQFPEYDTPILFGNRVTVVGGGNVAMDAARTAMRLGAKSVNIVYRRSEEELPARRAEVHHAKQEGIIFNLLANPVRLEGDEKGWVQRMQCIKMELGEPDASGRRSPIPIEGSEFYIPTDLVVVSIGTSANPLIPSTLQPDLQLNKSGYIITDEFGRTSIPRVYAGGDIVTGSATVISAMGAGRKAAQAIHEDITGGACVEQE